MRVTGTSDNLCFITSISSRILLTLRLMMGLFSRERDLMFLSLCEEGRATPHSTLTPVFISVLCMSPLFLYSTGILWMHQFKDICLWLTHICLEFHLFHPVFWFPNNLPPSQFPCCSLFHCAVESFQGASRGEQSRPVHFCRGILGCGDHSFLG